MKTITLSPQDIREGNLILVNRTYPYHENSLKDTLVPLQINYETILLENRTVALLSRLLEEIKAWKQIAAVSGWRSIYEQQQIWDNSQREYGNRFTEKFVALPYHSEHHTGLAVDLAENREDIDFICPEFPYHGICQSFREKAATFGFIERYPLGKEEITGIAHEPWHFRYVGVPHAAIMQEKNLTLEEYIVFLKQYSFGKASYEYSKNACKILISYIKAKEQENTVFEIDEKIPHLISGNNVDGFIITEWR